ncbi:ras-domain-containing protein [Pholiota conissans]|uniref:Ras-domain-containing protein n=1 Tax=Pholiota conissans TaxID=109636 RepID=A0A9P6CXL2_9AGAR|nr:ras-domain-containing protein [Pholiota conissans]
MSGITWHYVFKFIITGDAAVGKSSLLVRLTDQRFLANPDPTLGVEFGSKLITIPEENKVVKLQCWDTAGQESFRAITRSYYRGAAGCLLVYDVTSRKSFQNVRNWLADVREHADPHVSCILVGNKVDLCEDVPPASDNAVPTSASPAKASSTKHTKSGSSPSKSSAKGKSREVPYEEAELWAKEEGLLFVEASAKSGLNVEEAFVEASRDILEKIKKGVFDDERSPGVKLSTPNTNIALEAGGGKGGCC